jgi:arylsulfatase A-like enzyme
VISAAAHHAHEAQGGAQGRNAFPFFKMNHTLFLILIVLWCALRPASIAAPVGNRPNIVFILADDLGHGDVGCYGAKHIRTPNIDRIAAEGMRFTNFYVAQPVCTASRAALLSGCYANRVGMVGALNHTSPTGIHPREKLISTLLKEQGYATAAYGKWHLGHHPAFWPTRRGFDEFFGLPYSNDNGPLHPVTPGIPPLPLYDGDKVVELDPHQSLFTRRITDRAVRFIETHAKEPFFLYVPHIMPHVPIFASEPWRGKSGAGVYGDVVEELDSSVGEILSALKRTDLETNTLLVFTSDNGPFLSYGEHAGSAAPFREGKLTTFEGGVHMPCVVRWPGRVPAGVVSDVLIAAMDFYPTFAALCGAPLPEAKIDGVDVSKVLLGAPNATGREVFWYYSGDELQAVRQGPWKLHVPHEYLTVAAEPGRGGKPSNWGNLKPKSIQESGIQGIASRHGYRVESLPLSLYNLQSDPGETHNCAAEYPDIVARLHAEVTKARAELGDGPTAAMSPGVRAAGDVRTR